MASSQARRRALQNPDAFPTRQMFVLALARLCEPIAFMSIFPYIYYMVLSFHITSNDKQIAMYAGMVTSAFALAEFSTSVIWGRLSDRIGRKPVLMFGLAGTGLSMLVFGFAPNLTTALIARALGGLLNGNIAVLQTTVAEVVTKEAHQARAYAIMPFVWCIGTIIGSGLGGSLADPVRNYPGYFEPGTIFERFPYLLPNLVCAFVVVLGLLVAFLFLEETHEDRKHHRDIGIEAGDWILGHFHSNDAPEKGGLEEDLHLLAEAVSIEPPAYASTESSPVFAAVTTVNTSEPKNQISSPVAAGLLRSQSAVSTAFTHQVILNIVSYAILAYHTITADQLLPILFSMPESEQPPHLPFQFIGGFALSTKDIGFILSVQGFIQMFVTIIVFPAVNRRLGNLATFRLATLPYPILYLLAPYLTLAPDWLRLPGIYTLLVWKVTSQAFTYPSLAIMLANSAPSRKVLGTLNGVAASSASLSRTFGPTLSGLLQSAGLSIGCLGLPWWISGLVAVGGAVLSLFMVEENKRYSKESDPLQDGDDVLRGIECVDLESESSVEGGRSEAGPRSGHDK